jgi:hypothetical protein
MIIPITTKMTISACVTTQNGDISDPSAYFFA